MKQVVLMSALIATLSLVACDKQPTVINVPAATVAVPGPAGPQGDAGVPGDKGVQGNQGSQGYDGNKGDTGKAGDGTTVIVVPPAPAASSTYSLTAPGSKP